ncbi:MAG: hypothetical protein ABIC95_06960, partial [archaeon]
MESEEIISFFVENWKKVLGYTILAPFILWMLSTFIDPSQANFERGLLIVTNAIIPFELSILIFLA